MARTFHHGDRGKQRVADRTGVDVHWFSNEPKWWRRTFKHKKRRVELARTLTRFHEGNDDLVWPLDRKPWRYYW